MSTEPILLGAVLAAIAAVIVWFARTTLETRDRVRDVVSAIYGPPQAPGTNGMKREVERHTEQIRALRDDVREIGAGVERWSQRLQPILSLMEVQFPRRVVTPEEHGE